jgi:hypothetical protein
MSSEPRAYLEWFPAIAQDFAMMGELPDRSPRVQEYFEKLRIGERVGASPVASIPLHPDFGTKLTDSIGNSHGLLIVSQRLQEAIEAAGEPVESIPIRIARRKEPYFFVNVLRSVDCFDRSRSRQGSMWAGCLAVKPGRIPKDARLFRIAGQGSTVIARFDLARELGRRFGGLAFKKVKPFPEGILSADVVRSAP